MNIEDMVKLNVCSYCGKHEQLVKHVHGHGKSIVYTCKCGAEFLMNNHLQLLDVDYTKAINKEPNNYFTRRHP